MSCNVIYIDLEVKISTVVIYFQIKISKQQCSDDIKKHQLQIIL